MLHLLVYAIPDAKPLRTFAGIALETKSAALEAAFFVFEPVPPATWIGGRPATGKRYEEATICQSRPANPTSQEMRRT